MSVLDFFKLEKLKVEVYDSPERASKGGKPLDTFSAMFNPEAFTQKYAICFSKKQGLNSTGTELKYVRTLPEDLQIKLLFDGNGVDEMGVFRLTTKSVEERVREFLKLTMHMYGAIHEPCYLRVAWGDLDFPCRLKSVSVSYNQFDRHGKALRATLDCVFSADKEEQVRLAEENKQSPDLTHKRVVKSGDTLPLLTREVYGSAKHYLVVAKANNLSHFRNLSPGQVLYFPPLTK